MTPIQTLAYKALSPFAKRRYREEDWLLALLVHDEAGRHPFSPDKADKHDIGTRCDVSQPFGSMALWDCYGAEIYSRPNRLSNRLATRRVSICSRVSGSDGPENRVREPLDEAGSP